MKRLGLYLSVSLTVIIALQWASFATPPSEISAVMGTPKDRIAAAEKDKRTEEKREKELTKEILKTESKIRSIKAESNKKKAKELAKIEKKRKQIWLKHFTKYKDKTIANQHYNFDYYGHKEPLDENTGELKVEEGSLEAKRLKIEAANKREKIEKTKKLVGDFNALKETRAQIYKSIDAQQSVINDAQREILREAREKAKAARINNEKPKVSSNNSPIGGTSASVQMPPRSNEKTEQEVSKNTKDPMQIAPNLHVLDLGPAKRSSRKLSNLFKKKRSSTDEVNISTPSISMAGSPTPQSFVPGKRASQISDDKNSNLKQSQVGLLPHQIKLLEIYTTEATFLANMEVLSQTKLENIKNKRDRENIEKIKTAASKMKESSNKFLNELDQEFRRFEKHSNDPKEMATRLQKIYESRIVNGDYFTNLRRLSFLYDALDSTLSSKTKEILSSEKIYVKPTSTLRFENPTEGSIARQALESKINPISIKSETNFNSVFITPVQRGPRHELLAKDIKNFSEFGDELEKIQCKMFVTNSVAQASEFFTNAAKEEKKRKIELKKLNAQILRSNSNSDSDSTAELINKRNIASKELAVYTNMLKYLKKQKALGLKSLDLDLNLQFTIAHAASLDPTLTSSLPNCVTNQSYVDAILERDRAIQETHPRTSPVQAGCEQPQSQPDSIGQLSESIKEVRKYRDPMEMAQELINEKTSAGSVETEKDKGKGKTRSELDLKKRMRSWNTESFPGTGDESGVSEQDSVSTQSSPASSRRASSKLPIGAQPDSKAPNTPPPPVPPASSALEAPLAPLPPPPPAPSVTTPSSPRSHLTDITEVKLKPVNRSSLKTEANPANGASDKNQGDIGNALKRAVNAKSKPNPNEKESSHHESDSDDEWNSSYDPEDYK
jgi:hypothetical protein